VSSVLLAHVSGAFAPVEVFPITIAGVAYWARVRTLSWDGRKVPLWRQLCFGSGLLLISIALFSPIGHIAEELVIAHMVEHLLIGDLATLLLVLGLTRSLLQPILAIRLFNRLQILTHPFVAFPLWALNFYLWHVPALYDAAYGTAPIHALEHMSFFVGGTLMWMPVLEILPAPAWFGTGAKLGYIVVVRMVETVLGNVFIWTSHAFYPWYVHANPLWGIGAVRDQNLAGVVMMIEGSLVTFGALVWLFLKLASEGELRQELIERGVDPAQASRAVRYGRGRELKLQLDSAAAQETRAAR